MRNNSGLLVVFSGPSGVGKDSLLQRLLEVNPQIRLSVSATTRFPSRGRTTWKGLLFPVQRRVSGND